MFEAAINFSVGTSVCILLYLLAGFVSPLRLTHWPDWVELAASIFLFGSSGFLFIYNIAEFLNAIINTPR
jgi:hypothetical protein